MAQIFRVERTKNFTVMSNHHFKNKNLTLKAKGLLSLMLSLPDDWNYNMQGLATLSRDGIDHGYGNMKTATSGAARKKINASFQSMMTAITVAPITRNGARTTSRISMATASFIWFTSLVIRVIREGVPI